MNKPYPFSLCSRGPFTKAQSTFIFCPNKSEPFKLSIASCASANVSYSTKAYPYNLKDIFLKIQLNASQDTVLLVKYSKTPFTLSE